MSKQKSGFAQNAHLAEKGEKKQLEQFKQKIKKYLKDLGLDTEGLEIKIKKFNNSKSSQIQLDADFRIAKATYEVLDDMGFADQSKTPEHRRRVNSAITISLVKVLTHHIRFISGNKKTNRENITKAVIGLIEKDLIEAQKNTHPQSTNLH